MFTQLIFFTVLNLLGAMSPGPDFAIVTRYGLTGSRKAALLAAAGIALALFVHVFYCVIGIAVLIQSSQWIFLLLQTAGAIYLGTLGIKLLLAAKHSGTPGKTKLSPHPFRDGLLTNLLNPKASMFLISLFAEFITPDTPLIAKIAYGLLVPTIAFGWFSFLSLMLTHRRFLPHLQRYQTLFIKAMGVLLLLLAIIVLTSAALSLLN